MRSGRQVGRLAPRVAGNLVWPLPCRQSGRRSPTRRLPLELPPGSPVPSPSACLASEGLEGWLAQRQVALALTTYRANLLLLLGRNLAGGLRPVMRSAPRSVFQWEVMDKNLPVWLGAPRHRSDVFYLPIPYEVNKALPMAPGRACGLPEAAFWLLLAGEVPLEAADLDNVECYALRTCGPGGSCKGLR